MSTECECPRGEYKCSHAAALFIHGIHHLSRTDVECTWRKKQVSKNVTLVSAREMFPASKPYKALSREPNETDRSEMYADLKKYGQFTGLAWLMSAEPRSNTTMPIFTVGDIISSKECIDITSMSLKIKYIKEKVQVNTAQIMEVSAMTSGQRDESS